MAQIYPRFRSSLSVFVIALAIQVAAAPVAAFNVLTPENFEGTVAEGLWFVEYFSPYCPHCRNFAPTWNAVVLHFGNLGDSNMHFAQVNCALNGDLCSAKGVTGYPQMNLYRDRELLDTFSGNRDFDLLIDFLVQHMEWSPIATPAPLPEAEKPLPVPTPEVVPTLAAVPLHAESPPNPSGSVVSLDVETFNGFVSQGQAFVKFFAPWCGHCKKLAPTWTQLARHMQHKMNIAEVNCDENKPLCIGQGVTGYPALFYYAYGAKTEYTGSRKYDQLVTFTEQASNPTMQSIEAVDLERVVRAKPVVYLLLHTPGGDKLTNDVVKEVQLLFGSPPVYISSSEDLLDKYDVRPDIPYAVLAFKDRDAREPTAVFYPSLSQPADALKHWLLANRLPTSLELSRDVFQQVMNAPHQPLVIIVSTPRGSQDFVAERLNDIGKKWRLKMNQKGERRDVVFTWMDADQWGKWMMGMYGIKTGQEPQIIVADHESLLYYDNDGSGQPIKLTFTSISSTLEAIFLGTAIAKHSENFIERLVRVLDSGIGALGELIASHLYAAVVLTVIATVFLFTMVRRWFYSDFEDSHPNKRYAKAGRLD